MDCDSLFCVGDYQCARVEKVTRGRARTVEHEVPWHGSTRGRGKDLTSARQCWTRSGGRASSLRPEDGSVLLLKASYCSNQAQPNLKTDSGPAGSDAAADTGEEDNER